MNSSSVQIARILYLILCVGTGMAIAHCTKGSTIEISWTTGLLVGLGFGSAFIGIERLLKLFSLRGFSHATFGFGIGILCAWLLTKIGLPNLMLLVLDNKIESAGESQTLKFAIYQTFNVVMYSSLGFLGTALSLRSSRDDFSFVIPFVRFRQEGRSGQPILIDTEMFMDGRILRIISSGFISGRIIIPKFVIDEVEKIAKSETDFKRQGAQRSLKNIEQMHSMPNIELSIHESKTDNEARSLQERLLEVSHIYNARLLTGNDDIAKYAKSHGVSVLNLFDLQQALNPTVAVGEPLRVSLVRPGKEPHQAVGYLLDGSMVVVNHAVNDIGKSVDCVVITMLETGTGTLVFADIA